MDWTGQCYGLPATPTTDILSKVFEIGLPLYICRCWLIILPGVPRLICDMPCHIRRVRTLQQKNTQETKNSSGYQQGLTYKHIACTGFRFKDFDTLLLLSQVQIRSLQRLRNAWLALAQLCWLLLTELPTEISNSNIVCQLCGAFTHLAWMLFWATSGM